MFLGVSFHPSPFSHTQPLPWAILPFFLEIFGIFPRISLDFLVDLLCSFGICCLDILAIKISRKRRYPRKNIDSLVGNSVGKWFSASLSDKCGEIIHAFFIRNTTIRNIGLPSETYSIFRRFFGDFRPFLSIFHQFWRK